MTHLGGHCLETVLEALQENEMADAPTCFIAYTIKGYGLPLAGHRCVFVFVFAADSACVRPKAFEAFPTQQRGVEVGTVGVH